MPVILCWTIKYRSLFKRWQRCSFICLGHFLMGQPRPLFVYFHMTKKKKLAIDYKRIHGMLGTRTRGGSMVGADEST